MIRQRDTGAHGDAGVPACSSSWHQARSDSSNIGGPGRHKARVVRSARTVQQPDPHLSFVAVFSWPQEEVRNRAYDPGIGRWMSRDPIGEKGGLNLYAYVGNRPYDIIDQNGLCGSPWWHAAGAVLGIVGGAFEVTAGVLGGIATSWSGVGGAVGFALAMKGAADIYTATIALYNVSKGQEMGATSAVEVITDYVAPGNPWVKLTGNIVDIAATLGIASFGKAYFAAGAFAKNTWSGGYKIMSTYAGGPAAQSAGMEMAGFSTVGSKIDTSATAAAAAFAIADATKECGK